jgi:hypothetical protein
VINSCQSTVNLIKNEVKSDPAKQAWISPTLDKVDSWIEEFKFSAELDDVRDMAFRLRNLYTSYQPQ